MIFGIFTMFIALCISAVAIYYSVAGLVAIFAAAAIPIIIMGGVLEVGKLVTAVWLHRYWNKAAWWMRTYLGIAVLVLMFITSMGIFGFLSKAHIEQTSAAQEQVAQLERFEDEIARQRELIDRAEARIVKAETDASNQDTGIQEKIDREQDRINTAYSRRQPSIDEQQAIITAQQTALDNRVAVYEDEIDSLDTELTRLNGLVDQYRTELANTGVASTEAQVQPYLDQIAQLDTELARLNTQANEYEERITNLQPDNAGLEEILAQIDAIEQEIIRVTNQINSNEQQQVRAGQAIIGVTSDGLFGSNTRTALAKWVEAQRNRITELQSQAGTLRQNAQDRVEVERTRLSGVIADIRGAQTDRINERKQSLLNTIQRIREDAASGLDGQRAAIQTKIDTVLNTDIPDNRDARRVAQQQITELRNQPDPKVEAARAEIARIRALADDEIAQAQVVIERLRAEITVGDDADLDAIVDEQTARIKAANDEIDNIIAQKFALQAEARKLEAEVGPVKYIAEFVYGEADRDILEEAVRWVIVTIIFVFDPLAVMLLIAAQYTFEWNRKPQAKKIEPQVEPIEEEPEVEEYDISEHVEPEPTPEPEPQEEEKELDTEPYDPYNDTREDSELTAQELSQRHNMKLYSPDGRLAGTGKTIKKITIKQTKDQ